MQRMNFPSMSAKKGSLSSNFNNPDPRLRLSCLHSELDVSLLKWCQCILQLHTLLRSFVEIQLDDLTSLRSVSLSSPCCDAEEGRKRVRDEDIQTYGIEALSEVVAKRKELIEMVERGITMSSEEERETKLEYIRQQLIVCAETSETLFDTEIDNTYDDEHRDFASFVEEQQESTMNEFGGLMLFPNQHRHSPFFPRSDRGDVHRESSEETKCDNLASSLYRERNNNEDYTYELENDDLFSMNELLTYNYDNRRTFNNYSDKRIRHDYFRLTSHSPMLSSSTDLLRDNIVEDTSSSRMQPRQLSAKPKSHRNMQRSQSSHRKNDSEESVATVNNSRRVQVHTEQSIPNLLLHPLQAGTLTSTYPSRDSLWVEYLQQSQQTNVLHNSPDVPQLAKQIVMTREEAASAPARHKMGPKEEQYRTGRKADMPTLPLTDQPHHHHHQQQPPPQRQECLRLRLQPQDLSVLDSNACVQDLYQRLASYPPQVSYLDQMIAKQSLPIKQEGSQQPTEDANRSTHALQDLLTLRNVLHNKLQSMMQRNQQFANQFIRLKNMNNSLYMSLSSTTSYTKDRSNMLFLQMSRMSVALLKALYAYESTSLARQHCEGIITFIHVTMAIVDASKSHPGGSMPCFMTSRHAAKMLTTLHTLQAVLDLHPSNRFRQFMIGLESVLMACTDSDEHIRLDLF